jgi:hypothetical protein
MTVYQNGWYFDSRSTNRWGVWATTVDAYLACPPQGSWVNLGFSVTDLGTGESQTLGTPQTLWYPGC